MLKLTCVMVLALAVPAWLSAASAGERYLAGPRLLPAPERRGCYWYQQELLCGRYCYTEINGRRYCREHQFEAVPQAPWLGPPNSY